MNEKELKELFTQEELEKINLDYIIWWRFADLKVTEKFNKLFNYLGMEVIKHDTSI